MNRLPIALILTVMLAACASSGTSNRGSANPDLEPVPFSPEPRLVDVDDYLEFLDELSVAVGEGVPRELSMLEREQYRDTDSALRSMLDRVGNISELSEESQVHVFNLHQELQGIVIGDPENYMICSRQSTVGTHFKRVSCMPAGDFRRQQERHREALRQRLGAGPMPTLEIP